MKVAFSSSACPAGGRGGWGSTLLVVSTTGFVLTVAVVTFLWAQPEAARHTASSARPAYCLIMAWTLQISVSTGQWFFLYPVFRGASAEIPPPAPLNPALLYHLYQAGVSMFPRMGRRNVSPSPELTM